MLLWTRSLEMEFTAPFEVWDTRGGLHVCVCVCLYHMVGSSTCKPSHSVGTKNLAQEKTWY